MAANFLLKGKFLTNVNELKLVKVFKVVSTTPPQLILTLGFAKLPFCSPALGIITNAYSYKPHAMPNFWMDFGQNFFFFK